MVHWEHMCWPTAGGVSTMIGYSKWKIHIRVHVQFGCPSKWLRGLTVIYLSQGKFGAIAHHHLAIRGPEVEAARRHQERPEMSRAARGYGDSVNVYSIFE